MIWLWILFGLCVIVFGILYSAYYYCFRKNKASMIDECTAPGGKVYEPHAKMITCGIDLVLQHTHEDVYITSRDGLKLHGKYYHQADGAPLVIFMRRDRSHHRAPYRQRPEGPGRPKRSDSRRESPSSPCR